MVSIDQLRQRLLKGIAIPAHPLALTLERKFDERNQRALTRYYMEAGAGGIAVGVHTTQFAIHDPKVGLLKPVLQLAAETVAEQIDAPEKVMIAGLCGMTKQALEEANLATTLGYHAGLLSLAAFENAAESEILAHCREVSQSIPVFGFYLQPAVGGRVLSYRFWRSFCEIENVVAIKIAPFNRYQTLDVVRAVCDSGRSKQIALYTGNDDSIVMDLLSEYRLSEQQLSDVVGFRGGLLGHWACWTSKAVELHQRIRSLKQQTTNVFASEYRELLTLNHQVTDMNAAIFDAANHFHGCIAGIHEVLFRQGLLQSPYCLDPQESLSAGQAAEITRVIECYPHLVDDDFIVSNLERWMS